jgi:D-alanyl-D-alanine dipeptidase
MKFLPIVFFSFLFFGFPKKKPQEPLVNLKDLSTEFVYEIRYATPNNFIGETLYDCSECLLRPEVAEALLRANQYFCEKGYRIKIYDCYRPLDVQKRMWAKVPRPTYVGNPYGNGSIHNKAAAVDITLETLEGCYVEMGSDYDYFGREAHIDNYNFSKEILANRKLLIEGMRQFGFNTIRTEWWHFSYKRNWGYKTLNIPLPCD